MEHEPIVVTFEPEPFLESKAFGAGSPRGGMLHADTPYTRELREIALEVAGDAATADALVRRVQDALQEIAAEQAQIRPGLFVAARSDTGSLLQSLIADDEAAARRAVPTGFEGKGVKFDHSDLLGWARSLFHMLINKNPADWRVAPAAPERVGNTLRIAAVGDWGTGMYGAPVISRTLAAQTFDIMMHLGDVYYSGTKKEVRTRFLDIWPKNPNTLHRALNGNHEMYSGGHGYFESALPAFGQGASHFAFANDNWVLVGLDTGYEENDLANNQDAWLREIVRNAGERKVVLFTHHQPFSRFESQGEDIVLKIRDLLNARRIFAWYHGHEHRCMVYDPHPQWGSHHRCLGHGGMPYKRSTDLNAVQNRFAANGAVWLAADANADAPAGMIWDALNPYIDDPDYNANGYLTLEIEGRHLTELLHAADGTVIYRRQLA